MMQSALLVTLGRTLVVEVMSPLLQTERVVEQSSIDLNREGS